MPIDEYGQPYELPASQPVTDTIIGYDDIGRPIYGVTTTGTNTVDITTEDKASNLELNLLQQVQDRADFIQQVWRNNYLGCELNVLAEMDADVKDVVSISTVSAIAAASTASSFASAQSLVSQYQNNNCMTNSCNFTSRLAIEEAKSKSNAIMSDLNYEYEHVELLNADRLNTRMAMINPGRNGMVQAMNSLVAASRIQAELKAQAAANAGGNGLIAGRVLSALGGGLSQLEKSGFFKPTPTDYSRPDFLRGSNDAVDSTTAGADIVNGLDLSPPPEIINGLDLPDSSAYDSTFLNSSGTFTVDIPYG